MTPGAKKNALRDTRVAADGDLLEVEDPCAFADPCVLTERQLPGPMNADAVANECALSDIRPESAKDCGTQFGRTPPTHEDGARCHQPQDLHNAASTDLVAVTCESGEIALHVGHVGMIGITRPGHMMRSAVTQRSTRVTVIGLNYLPEPTGIAPYTTYMSRGLADRGYEVRVVTAFPHYPTWRREPRHQGTWRHEEQDDGVHVSRIRHYLPSPPTGLRRAVSEIAFGVHAIFTRWRSPDVVICISPALLASAIAVAVARMRRVPVGIVVQDLYSAGVSEAGAKPALAKVFAAIESRTLRAADGVSVIHDRFGSRLEADLGVPASRITTIRNWTHLNAAEQESPERVRETLGWSSHQTVVLHAGAMGKKQGLESVLSAALLAEERGTPVRFVLMGDGSERASLEAASAGCASIQFVDPRPDQDFVATLRAADILLVNERPGLHETAVPSKLTSYFASGRPVIAAVEPKGTTAEEVAAADGGLQVPPDDPEALLDAILTLRSDDALRQRLGANGNRFRDDVLSEGAAIDAYASWVQDLAATRKRIRTDG